MHPGAAFADKRLRRQLQSHAHALVSDGVFTPEGEFLPLPSLDTATVMEVFRRLLLDRLRAAERLSETFFELEVA